MASIMAGPGRLAIAHSASSTAADSARGVAGRTWWRVTASKAARWPAVSCIQPRSPASLGTWVVMCSTRKLDASASPIPAKALNAPGPVLVMQMPTRPVVRAYPTAANAAACSWRTTTVRMGEPLSASHRLSACCPGIPNTISTPCASSAATSRSAPVASFLSCATLIRAPQSYLP
jgi:hypothetical protein